MSRWKKIGRFLLRATLIMVLTLLLVELVYRYQWVDFYKQEWTYQKKEMRHPAHPERRILVLGDSFSADPNSWVNQWKTDSLENNAEVYNAAIPGVGPETYRLIIHRRIKEVIPTDVIVQLYVGNDLYDISKPVNWSAHSLSRNLFWSISGKIRVLGFINYRLGQASVETANPLEPKADEVFDVKHYSPRTKLYLKGDSNYPATAIQMKGSGSEELIEMLSEMKEEVGDEVEFHVLIIPHCCQVAQSYVDRYEQLGARSLEEAVGSSDWTKKLEKAGFSVIDPLRDLQQAETNEPVYFPNDPHLNKVGQAVVLKCTRRWFEE